MGTLGYMSPEQVKGKPADARSDIFSFGAILHEMLSGSRAFYRDTAAETMSAILREEPPGPLGHQQERPAGARAGGAALPGEEPRGAVPLGARPGVRPRRRCRERRASRPIAGSPRSEKALRSRVLPLGRGRRALSQRPSRAATSWGAARGILGAGDVQAAHVPASGAIWSARFGVRRQDDADDGRLGRKAGGDLRQPAGERPSRGPSGARGRGRGRRLRRPGRSPCF